MLERTENGKLKMNTLDLDIFYSGLFEKCNNERELDWLQEQLQGCLENKADERREELSE